MLMLLQAAAQATAEVAHGAVQVADPGSAITFESYVHQAGLAALTVWVIQTLKTAKWFPAINANSANLTRWVSTLSALAGALAIQISVTGDATAGWHGSFAIPNIHALWDAAVRFIGSKVGQEGLYKLLYKEPAEVVPVTPPAMDPGGKPVAPPQPLVPAKPPDV